MNSSLSLLPNASTPSKFGNSTSRKNSAYKFRFSTQAGKKISKIRWLKTGQNGIIPDALLPEYFVVGSWGETENEISLWKLSIHGSKSSEEGTRPQIRLVKRVPVLGNISDVVAVQNDAFALTTSFGTTSLFKLTDMDHNGVNPNSFQTVSSKKLHRSIRGENLCPATGIAVSEKSLTSVGEDGSIFELSLDHFEVVQSLENVDQLSICCVEYTAFRTIGTGNIGGQVKLWDLRTGERKATKTLNHLDELSSAISIAPHPTQPHILLVGYSSGATDLWDTRGSSSEPIANLQQQNGGVSEIFFHPVNPDNFYTCSQSGEVSHWFTAENITESDLVQNNDYETDLNLEFLKYGLNSKTLYASPFPINSMNLSRNNRLICGGDSGIMFCTEKS